MIDLLQLHQKYLFDGSPFIPHINEQSLFRISQSIVEKNSWPQDAIGMEISIGGNPLLTTRLGESFEIFAKKGIRLLPADLAQIGLGYALCPLVINIAIRALQGGEEAARAYLNNSPTKDNDLDKRFCIMYLPKLRQLFADDKTCSNLFPFIELNSLFNNELNILGMEIAKLTFDKYVDVISKQLIEAHGSVKAGMMWQGK